MITIMSALLSVLSFRFRRRASLELELVALRHQLAVLRRQRPGRLRILATDRLLWMWLYRIWPRALNAMVLVKPATVIQWHRKGFRLYWRWRSRSRSVGRPQVSSKTRDLIRQMSMANPLWGAPRIHGELLKLGIEVSQATVGRYLPWRPKVPSPTWRTFLQNNMTDIVAVDMFVVATATFRLFYALILLGHDRRRIIHFNVTQNPTRAWLSRQITEAFPGRPSRATCCATAMRRLVRASAIEFTLWVSRRSLPRRDAPGRTPTSSASLGQSAANVSITSSSSMSASYAGFCRRIFNIITRPEPISRSTRIVRNLALYTHPPRETLSPSRRLVACIIATNAAPRELFW